MKNENTTKKQLNKRIKNDDYTINRADKFVWTEDDIQIFPNLEACREWKRKRQEQQNN